MARAAKTEDRDVQARVQEAVSSLEQKTLEVMGTLKEEGRKAERTAQEHVWITAGIALLLGLVLGLVLGLTGRR